MTLREILKRRIMEKLRENSQRITHAAEEIHQLNDEPIEIFANKYKGDRVDIFFTNSGTAHVVKRMDNLTWHGRDAGKSLKLNDVKYVYAGLEDEFYSPQDFGKLLKSVYNGSKSKIRGINPA